MIRKESIAHTYPCKTSPEVIGKILELRREYQLGALRIVYYLDCYHAIKISESTMTRVLKAHDESRLPKTAPKQALYSKRYAKEVPGYHVQVDVKFLCLKDQEGKLVQRYQYTAIDAATVFEPCGFSPNTIRILPSSSSTTSSKVSIPH